MKISLCKNRIRAVATLGIVNSLTLFSRTITSSNLPIIDINTHVQMIVNEPKITADMGIIHKGTRYNIVDTLNDQAGSISINYAQEKILHSEKWSYSNEKD